MSEINANSIVSMHFDIRLKDGSVADSTREFPTPMSFKIGDGSFSEKMESELMGLKVGDKKKVMLLPADAFGESHPANIYQIPTHKMQQLEEGYEEGSIILFTQPNGQEVPGIVREIGEKEVTIDFNHPLSGRVVLFDLEIMGVEEEVSP